MKNVVVFITHKTLAEDHVQCTFLSMFLQHVPSAKKFDELYIYNTHQDELSNEKIINLFNYYNLQSKFKEIKILNSDQETKSLGEDIGLLRNHFIKNYQAEDRILLLKSDCVLSKNYFEEILNMDQNKQVYFVAPFVCAKSNVSNEEIISYSQRDKFIKSDDVTFFVEDQNRTANNDFNDKKDVSIYDKKIKFTSCYVIRDFSCHFLSVGLLPEINIEIKSWGGCNFENLTKHFVETNKCFVIHKYHDIISENRTTDREGPVSSWLKS